MANEAFIDTIYKQLRDLYGKGETELFQLEFPARLLDKGTYFYDGNDGRDAQQIKPQSIVDAEFRLANDMLPISNIIGGPNGRKVSSAFDDILNQLVPSSSKDSIMGKTLIPDQKLIVEWLEELVDDIDPPHNDVLNGVPANFNKDVPKKGEKAKVKKVEVKEVNANTNTNEKEISEKTKISRIDLYQKLLDVYEGERYRWAEFKTNARPDFKDALAVEKYDRMLAYFAPSVDARLEALWAVVLIRGQYHRVRRYIGFLDVKSSSELLQKAKENMRASVMRSLDDSEDVYPVYFSPASWAQYLSTSFQPEDLLAQPQQTRTLILMKEGQRDFLITRRNGLQGPTTNIAELEKAETEAKKAYSTANSKLRDTYTSNTLAAINGFFDFYLKQAKDKIAAIEGVTEGDFNKVIKSFQIPSFSTEDVEKIKSMQKEILKTTDALALRSDAYLRAQKASSVALAGETQTEMRLLQGRIDALATEIKYLRKSLLGADNPYDEDIDVVNAAGTKETKPKNTLGDHAKIPEKAKTPPQDVATDNASIWQEVVLQMTRSTSTDTKFNKTSVAHSNFAVNLFFGSVSGSEDISTTAANSAAKQDSTDVSIAFRCMKVLMNRPWMDAGLLAQTKEFCHLNSNKISNYEPSEVKAALTTHDQKKLNETGKTILPSWTKGFIVVKDLHIIMSSDTEYTEHAATDIQQHFEEGGGFLCFSTHKAGDSSSHGQTTSIQQEGKRLSIKIPAPQIIGWISELCPKDETLDAYTGLTEEERNDLHKEGLPLTPPPEPARGEDEDE